MDIQDYYYNKMLSDKEFPPLDINLEVWLHDYFSGLANYIFNNENILDRIEERHKAVVEFVKTFGKMTYRRHPNNQIRNAIQFESVADKTAFVLRWPIDEKLEYKWPNT